MKLRITPRTYGCRISTRRSGHTVDATWVRHWSISVLRSVLAATCLLSVSAEAYFKVLAGNRDRGYGATREQACTNAVNATPGACKGTEFVDYRQGWQCIFWQEGYYVSCDNLPCGGFNCSRTNWKIYGESCDSPDIYDSLSGACKKVIAPKNEPPTCGDGSGGYRKATDNPVNLTTGNKFFRETDYRSPAGRHLRFERAWNSYNQEWHFSYRQNAKVVANGGDGFAHTVWIYRDDGRVVAFQRTAGGSWQSDPDIRDSLVEDGSNWLYTKSSGQREWYDSSGGLLRIAYSDGASVTVVDDGVAVAVSDEYGNELVLDLDGEGRVAALRDPDGETYRYAYNSEGSLLHVSYPDGTSDPGSNPFGEDNPYRTYHYEDPNNSKLVTGVTDENRERYKTVTYDGFGRAVTSGLGGGDVGQAVLDYTDIDDPIDPRVTVTNPLGKDAVYHLEHHYGVSNVKLVEGMPLGTCLADTQGKTFYATNGWLESETDKAGSVTWYTYYTDGARYGLLETRTEAAGTSQARVYTYDWDGATRQKTDESLAAVVEGVLTDLKKTRYTYDPDNRRLLGRADTDLTTGTVPYRTNGGTRVWSYAYEYHDDEKRQLKRLSVTDPRGNATVHDFSPEGFLTGTTNALGQVTRYLDHNGRGQPGTVIDANGMKIALSYTPRGWLDTVVLDYGGQNAWMDLDYDEVGQLTRITRVDGTYLALSYDAAHRLRAIENRAGERLEFDLDAAGNVTSEVARDATGAVARTLDYVFDALGRLHEVRGSNGQLTRYDYGSDGRLDAFTDALDRSAIPGFDALARLSSWQDAAAGVVAVAYDGENRVTRLTDQRGFETQYVYDGFGRIKQLTSPDTGATEYRYDAAGNRIEMTDARGVVTRYTYDALDRLTAISYPDDPAQNITLGYDNWSVGGQSVCTTCNGRVSALGDASGVNAFYYDLRGNLVLQQRDYRGSGYNVGYAWTLTDKLSGITYPSGRTVEYTLDALGRIEAIHTRTHAQDAAETIVSDISYEPFGRVRAYRYGNGIQHTVVRDLDGRVTSIRSGSGNGTVEDVGYVYDLADQATAVSDVLDHHFDQTFGYDTLDRLSAASGPYGSIGYTYDGVGNRRTRSTMDERGESTESYVVDDDSNRLLAVNTDGEGTRRFAYSATGNVRRDTRGSATTYYYDLADHLARMVRGEVTARYTYNALGQRAGKILSGAVDATENYVYDIDGNLIAVHDESGSVTREYIYLDGVMVAVLGDPANEPADSDGDGIADGLDNCPLIANPGQEDADGNGIGAACEQAPVGC